VLADTVKGNDSLVCMKMYWGKSGAVDSSNGAQVFDTASGFQAVFHMNEAANDTIRDVTKNQFKGVPLQTGAMGVPRDTTGAIGKAKVFNGSTNSSTGGYYQITNSATGKINFPHSGTYTVSCWANTDLINGNFRMLVCKKRQTVFAVHPRPE